ncbi:MAG TPA: ABC transporter ATP-binding protein [Clostridia bacterium]|nr:ABC transporter ATP-binding protein [Clostridia bacterium]
MAFFQIEGLTKRFGGLTAIDNFNLEMEEGELVGLIGPNGAGKTTVFNVVNGIYKPTSGKVLFKGNDITGFPPHKVAQMGVGRTFQNIRLFSNLTVFENVRIACHLMAGYNVAHALLRTGRQRREDGEISKRVHNLLELVGLEDRWNEKAKTLPYGHQRKLEIARALALNPSLILLDEPAAGMNPQESADLVEFIKQIRKQFSLTIFLIEHHMDVVMEICERIYVMNFGRTIAIGTPEEVQNNPDVIEAYLGEPEEETA